MNKLEEINIEDLTEFKQIRLRALKEEPAAFGVDYNELNTYDNEYWASQLNSPEKQIWYGYWDEGSLTAIAEIKFALNKKFAHIVKISGVYVIPEKRQKGIGFKFLQEVIYKAFADKKHLKIKLTVNCEQTAAINLYSKLGFLKVGKMQKEFNIGGVFKDAYLMEYLR